VVTGVYSVCGRLLDRLSSYLNIPFDLSQVLFIATANTTMTVPPALLDRMEVIEVPGYTQEEKVEIALGHLIPKQLEQHGLLSKQLEIPPNIISTVAANYTREAGVRNLERTIGSICRAIAVKVNYTLTLFLSLNLEF